MKDKTQNNDAFAEIRALLASAVFNDADDAQLDRLNELLKAEVELRRYASRFLHEESSLRRQFEMLERVVEFHMPTGDHPLFVLNGNDEEPILPIGASLENYRQTRPLWKRISSYYSVAITAALLAVALPAAIWIGYKIRPLSDEVGSLWQTDYANSHERSPSESKPIRVGDVIATRDGLVNIRFHSGSNVLLKGPAELEVLSPMCIALRYGSLTARVEESAYGFRVDTPNCRLIDLGTEFGLAVDEQGATNAAVFSGQVSVRYAGFRSEDEQSRVASNVKWAVYGETKLLSQGEAVRISKDGKATRLVSVRTTDFPLVDGNAEIHVDWPPIIKSVSDNLQEEDTSKCYRVVRQGLVDDSRAFVDTSYQWNGINSKYGLPNFLRGADYVMPFNERNLGERLEMRIVLGYSARLFVLFDNRVETPHWLLDEYHDTGYDVGIDEDRGAAEWFSLGVGAGVSVDRSMSVWYRDVPQPTAVVLGSMKSPAEDSLMYCVAAIPLELAAAIIPDPPQFHEPRLGSGLMRPDLLPTPAAEVAVDRVTHFGIMHKPILIADDAASNKNGIVFRVESNGGKFLPHQDVHAVDGTLPCLNDGEFVIDDKDLDRCVWYDGQGRFSVDLKRPRKISEINTYSYHSQERAAQHFSVWGSSEVKIPDTSFDEAKDAHGWELIGYVQTFDLGSGGIHTSSLRKSSGALGPYRHLLWITEDSVHGTCFAEIDIHAAD